MCPNLFEEHLQCFFDKDTLVYIYMQNVGSIKRKSSLCVQYPNFNYSENVKLNSFIVLENIAYKRFLINTIYLKFMDKLNIHCFFLFKWQYSSVAKKIRMRLQDMYSHIVERIPTVLTASLCSLFL